MDFNLEIVTLIKELVQDKNEKTKLLSEKICEILEKIPDLINFLNEDNENIIHEIISILSRYSYFKNYYKGDFIKKIYNYDNNFYMILSGHLISLEIKYKKVFVTFYEYIMYLSKLYLLKDFELYNDCLEKNDICFPFKSKEKNNNNKNEFDIIKKCIEINEINFEYKEELKKLKTELKTSLWKNGVGNINDFLELYNPHFNYNKKGILLKEIKYLVYLPYYVVGKTYKPYCFIGDLNRPKNMKNFTSYLCLSKCYVMCLDKSKLALNDKLFDLYNKSFSEFIYKNLLVEHHLFKNVDINFLKNNYSKYFKVVKLLKNQTLLKQGMPNKGIYFIRKGKFLMTSNRSYNDLIDLNYTILRSLDNLTQYVTDLKSEAINIDDFKKNNKNENEYKNKLNDLMKNENFIQSAKQPNEIIFCLYKEGDIVGLSDIYNIKTGINNFSLRCLTDEAELFFLPKEMFLSFLSEDTLYKKFGIFFIIGQKFIIRNKFWIII